MIQREAPFIGSIALLRQTADDATEQWLASWDDVDDCFSFPFAERGDQPSYRTPLLSAVGERFALDPSRDFLISGLSRAHFQAPIDWRGWQSPQWVVVQFFSVDLYGRDALPKIERQSQLRWVTPREVATQRTQDGSPLSQIQCELIQRDHLIPVKDEVD